MTEDRPSGPVLAQGKFERRGANDERSDFAGRAAPDSGFYASETPVNSFRLILSQLFDTTIGLLPDRSYFSTISQPYIFYDIDNPGSYPGTHGPGSAGGGIAVVAFPASGHAPDNPALYCRRLVTLKYRDQRHLIASFHFLPHAGMLAVDQAFALYRRSVAANRLPDLGASYESYAGRGPDQDSVVALFFPIPDTAR